jgi:hypothetical protein
MIRLFWLVFWGGLSVLVATAGLKARARKRAAFAAALPKVDDDAVRAIVESGTLGVDADEPLDLLDIGEEEERFWSESWEEPEEL